MQAVAFPPKLIGEDYLPENLDHDEDYEFDEKDLINASIEHVTDALRKASVKGEVRWVGSAWTFTAAASPQTLGPITTMFEWDGNTYRLEIRRQGTRVIPSGPVPRIGAELPNGEDAPGGETHRDNPRPSMGATTPHPNGQSFRLCSRRRAK